MIRCRFCGCFNFITIEDGIYECEDCNTLTARIDKLERLKELENESSKSKE